MLLGANPGFFLFRQRLRLTSFRTSMRAHWPYSRSLRPSFILGEKVTRISPKGQSVSPPPPFPMTFLFIYSNLFFSLASAVILLTCGVGAFLQGDLALPAFPRGLSMSKPVAGNRSITRCPRLMIIPRIRIELALGSSLLRLFYAVLSQRSVNKSADAASNAVLWF